MSSDRDGDDGGFSTPIDDGNVGREITFDERNRRWIVDYGQHIDQSPSEAIVNAVAEIAEEDIDDLEPLFYSVEPDALDRLFDMEGRQDNGDATLTFAYAGFRITVHRGGTIIMDPRE